MPGLQQQFHSDRTAKQCASPPHLVTTDSATATELLLKDSPADSANPQPRNSKFTSHRAPKNEPIKEPAHADPVYEGSEGPRLETCHHCRSWRRNHLQDHFRYGSRSQTPPWSLLRLTVGPMLRAPAYQRQRYFRDAWLAFLFQTNKISPRLQV